MRGRGFVLLCALAAAGCGGADPPTPEEEVRAALRAFAQASAARDEQRLCDRLLATSLKRKVERAGLPCEVALQVGLQDVRAPRLKVLSVKVTGARARARVRSSAAGQVASTDVVELVREGGTWRVTQLVGS